MPRLKKARTTTKAGQAKKPSSSLTQPTKNAGKSGITTLSQEDQSQLDQEDAEYSEQSRSQEKKRPASQLDLAEEELDEEHTRVLTAQNVHSHKELVRYKYGSVREWQSYTHDFCAIHFELDGYVIPNFSDEARRQKDSAVGPDGEEEGGDSTVTPTLRNQFNFAVRSSQTSNAPLRECGVQTQPPPHQTFSAMANQHEIWDAYVEERRMKEATKKNGAKIKTTQKQVQSEDPDFIADSVSSGAKILERMANQNTFDEISKDFKYWEDPVDEFQKQGSLLPLWKFDFAGSTKKRAITSVAWNQKFRDMFAVSMGSYDFTSQGKGQVGVFTLKNTSYPEYVFQLDSGAMCLDFSEQHPYLMCVGMYDGSVAILDITDSAGPCYQSSVKSGKHSDPVWQVKWQEDDVEKNINFHSVSSDGTICSWTLIKNELQRTEIIKLKMDPTADTIVGATEAFGVGAGMCFGFNKFSDHIYAVGTEEGKIHKCSKAYNSRYLHTWNGHSMAVYAVAWNHIDTNIFVTCSADWTVKVWHQNHKDDAPLFAFDLGTSVGDVAWAPFSSTVFACVTSDGKVYVFDLSEDKSDPICVQSVVKKAKLTKVAFNAYFPILCVGDDRGSTYSFKLSPNLRQATKIKATKGEDEWLKQERAKIGTLLSSFSAFTIDASDSSA